MVNIYLELDGLDDVTEDALKADSGKTSRGQAANFHAHWLGARNHRRQSCPKRKENRRFPWSSRRRKRRLGTSCSVKPQQRRQSRTTHRTATQSITSRLNQTTLSDFWKKELGGTFSDWRSDTQHGFSRDSMWEGVLEWSSCRHWYIVPWQDRDGTTTVRHLLRVNPGARRQRALDSKSQLAIRSMTETRNRQSILADARQWWIWCQQLHWMSQSSLVNRLQLQQVLSTRWVPRKSTRVQMMTDCLEKGVLGSWTLENGNELQTGTINTSWSEWWSCSRVSSHT